MDREQQLFDEDGAYDEDYSDAVHASARLLQNGWKLFDLPTVASQIECHVSLLRESAPAGWTRDQVRQDLGRCVLDHLELKIEIAQHLAGLVREYSEQYPPVLSVVETPRE